MRLLLLVARVLPRRQILLSRLKPSGAGLLLGGVARELLHALLMAQGQRLAVFVRLADLDADGALLPAHARAVLIERVRVAFAGRQRHAQVLRLLAQGVQRLALFIQRVAERGRLPVHFLVCLLLARLRVARARQLAVDLREILRDLRPQQRASILLGAVLLALRGQRANTLPRNGNVDLRLPNRLKRLRAALLDLLTDGLAPLDAAAVIGDLLLQLDQQLLVLLNLALAGEQAGHAGGARAARHRAAGVHDVALQRHQAERMPPRCA